MIPECCTIHIHNYSYLSLHDISVTLLPLLIEECLNQQWLRRLEDGSSEAEHIPENETLNWKGHRYLVLQATQVLTPGNGSFYTKVSWDIARNDKGVLDNSVR